MITVKSNAARRIEYSSCTSAEDKQTRTVAITDCSPLYVSSHVSKERWKWMAVQRAADHDFKPSRPTCKHLNVY